MPIFSIITPVYDTPLHILQKTIQSVQMQSVTDWEMILVDDCSPSTDQFTLLQELARSDHRLKVSRREVNGGIVHASNDCLVRASGEFVSFLDHDDVLYVDALEKVLAVINTYDDVDYIYTDEDLIDENDFRSRPFFKPDWTPERLRCQMYTCHFATMRRSLVDTVGHFDEKFEGSQDWDLVLRLTEQARRIEHIPEVLYGWRTLQTSTASDSDAKPYAFLAGQRASQAHCDRIGLEVEIQFDPAKLGCYPARSRLTESPLISIIIPTMGAQKMLRGLWTSMFDNCIRSIKEKSTYQNIEVLAVFDPSTPSSSLELGASLFGDNFKAIPYAKPFNFSEKVNIGAVEANGEYLMILNDDTEIITPSWLEEMLVYAKRPEIAVVGAKLLGEFGQIQHAGVSLGIGGPGHVLMGYDAEESGYFWQSHVTSNFLALTGACILVSTEKYFAAGGMSEILPHSFNDVDFCLKLVELGYRNVYTPEAQLYHFESVSRNPTVTHYEVNHFEKVYGKYWGNDGTYNPNLYRRALNYMVPADYVLRANNLI